MGEKITEIKPTVKDWRKDIVDTISSVISTLKTDQNNTPFFDIIFSEQQLLDNANISSINTPFYLFKFNEITSLQGNNSYLGVDENQLSISSFGGVRTVNFSVYIADASTAPLLHYQYTTMINRVRELNLFVGNLTFNSSNSPILLMGERYHKYNTRLFSECIYQVEVLEAYERHIFDIADIQSTKTNVII